MSSDFHDIDTVRKIYNYDYNFFPTRFDFPEAISTNFSMI